MGFMWSLVKIIGRKVKFLYFPKNFLEKVL
nr:MAG TPA: hypothetical protein [Caudoviricetes sp.]